MFDCRYWLWLSLCFEPGAVKCDALLHAFGGSPKAIFEADKKDYEAVCSNSPRTVNALCNKNLDRVYEILEYCEKNNVGILTKDDERYPSPLLKIQGQPPVLYYKGTVPNFSDRLSIAIVGTRNCTSYGTSAAYTMAHDIATAGGIIVSGMALGTDTAAHRGALDAQGTTVAFLGCGIDRVYPKENEYLMSEIIANGAVITDYQPGARPEGRHFPVRNRLISGVSHGVLVVEAAKKSGALITADHALKQGKLLYAIPGRIGELESEGTNKLLMSGAKTVTMSGHILMDFQKLFGIKIKQTPIGYEQFKPRDHIELSDPYKTPSYNPYANSTSTYLSKTDTTTFSNNFMPCPPTPTAPEPPKETAPKPLVLPNIKRSETANPYFTDLGRVPKKDIQGRTISEPKPIIIHATEDEEASARAYMSLSDQDRADIETIEQLVRRPVFEVRSDPVPEGGFTVELTPEKIAKFQAMEGIIPPAEPPDFDMSQGIKPVPAFECVTDLHELKRLADQDLLIHEERQRQRAEAKRLGLPDYTGLTNIEIKILKKLEDGNKRSLDALSENEIPLGKLISILTILEIKQRVIQLPGGYYEINKNFGK